MFKTLFARLMLTFISLILIVLGFFSFFSFFTIRKTVINNRMKEITLEARDVAYLIGNMDYSILNSPNKGMLEYLNYKIKHIQSEYGAYILTVDSTGKILDNFAGVYQDNVEFAKTLDPEKVYDHLLQVLSGKEISTQNLKTGDVVFSIGVPFIKNNAVNGAVFIHTAEQKIRAEYRYIATILIGVFIVSLSLSGLIAAIFTKRIIDPLHSMELAVNEFSHGKFKQRVAVDGSIETKTLAQSFNNMADIIEKNDSVRREFVANVSHELRSPVTSINGYVQGMLDKTIPQNKIPYYLEIVSSETMRLTKLIDDLLNLSRLENDKIELNLSNFNINETIRRVIISKIGEIELRNIEIDTNFEQEPVIVSADQDKIIQVVTNLLDNSLKFVDNNGYIMFKVSTANNRAFINVCDNGIGIDKDDLPYIFDRFYKHDKSRHSKNGTGLGLSISKQIIELHKEQIYAIENKQGAEIEFTLKLFKNS